MVEPLGVAASVIATIQITSKVISHCKYYIETTRDAPSDLKNVLVEVSTAKTFFESWKYLTEHCDGVSDTLRSLEGPVNGSRHAVNQLEKYLRPEQTDDERDHRRKRQKVKDILAALAWPFKAEKVKKLLQELSGFRGDITLGLTIEIA